MREPTSGIAAFAPDPGRGVAGAPVAQKDARRAELQDHICGRRDRRRRGLDVGLAGEGIVGDGELGLAQALDLVAQARGGLELEVGGGLAHLFLQAGDHGLQVVADQRLALLGEAGVHRNVVLLVDRGEHVGDVLLARSPA